MFPPEFVIIKPRNTTNAWAVFHAFSQASPLQGRLLLDGTGVVYNYGYNVWSQSSTTLGVYSNILAAPGTAINCIAYCFAPVDGYSSFGSYTGNGSADGPFVYTGFKPAFLIIKRTDASDHWYTYDNKREGYNPANEQLTANLSNAEYSSSAYPSHDFLSNGFKLTTNNVGRNASGGTYIYLAFAENPFNLARAR